MTPEDCDEVTEAGGALHPDGTITVFHRTSHAAAAAIYRTGRMLSAENGLFFTTRPGDETHAAGHGPATVELRIPAALLALDDVFAGEAHLRLPLPRAGDQVNVTPYLVEAHPPS